jgi:hypothetical protein
MAPRILEKALHSDIPDDVIRCNILPRLPFKLTTRLKVISSTPDIVGIPSGFDFLGCCLENRILSLLASTNGLVYILYTPTNFISHSRAPTLFIANPATQKAQSIPGTTKHITRFDKGIGLAFDPVDNFQENTVSKFKIVKAVVLGPLRITGLSFALPPYPQILAAGPCPVQPFMWTPKLTATTRRWPMDVESCTGITRRLCSGLTLPQIWLVS